MLLQRGQKELLTILCLLPNSVGQNHGSPWVCKASTARGARLCLESSRHYKTCTECYVIYPQIHARICSALAPSHAVAVEIWAKNNKLWWEGGWIILGCTTQKIHRTAFKLALACASRCGQHCLIPAPDQPGRLILVHT